MRHVLFALLLLPTIAVAQSVTVTGGKHDATNVVVTAEVDLPATVTVKPLNVTAQTTGKAITFVVPKLKSGETLELTASAGIADFVPKFSFKETKGEYTDVLFKDRPVLRYVNKPHDAKAHYLTFKPFHQVFDPKEGKVMLSSGAYNDPKDGLFPHHRGLFFGFNKISYEVDGKKIDADIWHGTKDVFSTADKTSNGEAGEVFARQPSTISWHGPDGKAFAEEQRTVTVYNVTGGTMLDWNTELMTKVDKVRLDGDPQHAGFHFRATQEVSKETAKKTYYLRPDGKGKEGDTRNWDAKGKDPKTVNLPWNAMCFETGGKRYTALRINHPDNPKETRGSERDYGRFGDYFEYDLTPKTPLKLKYRVWVQEGEMTGEQCEAMAHGFTDTMTVKVK